MIIKNLVEALVKAGFKFLSKTDEEDRTYWYYVKNKLLISIEESHNFSLSGNVDALRASVHVPEDRLTELRKITEHFGLTGDKDLDSKGRFIASYHPSDGLKNFIASINKIFDLTELLSNNVGQRIEFRVWSKTRGFVEVSVIQQ